MNNLVRSTKYFVSGVDFLSLTSRALFALSQFSATFFVLAFFPIKLQAIYFLFLAIISVQTIFELGLSQVIIIRLSSKLCSADKSGYVLENDLANIILFGLRKFIYISIWYFITAMILAAGLMHTSDDAPNLIGWLAPWVFLLCVYTLRLFLVFLESILEGFGNILDILAVRSVYYIAFILSFGISSYTGLELWSLGLAWATSIMTGFILYLTQHRGLLRSCWGNIIAMREDSATARSSEVAMSRFHGKVSVTWVASYAISNLPLLITYTIASEKLVTSLGVASQIAAIIGVIAAAISSPHISTASNRHSKGDAIGFVRQFKGVLSRTLGATVLTATACFSLPTIIRYYFPDRWSVSMPTSIELLPFLASALIYTYMACVGQFYRSTQHEVFNFPLVLSALVTLGGMVVAASDGSLLLLGIAQLIGPALVVLPLTLVKHYQLISQKDTPQ